MKRCPKLYDALYYHLHYNHYPPIHPVFIPVASKAIWYARRGNGSKKLKLPNGKELTVYDIMEDLHLDGFL